MVKIYVCPGYVCGGLKKRGFKAQDRKCHTSSSNGEFWGNVGKN
jgi:hypothetical protein